jgi:hypothetical protein
MVLPATLESPFLVAHVANQQDPARVAHAASAGNRPFHPPSLYDPIVAPIVHRSDRFLERRAPVPLPCNEIGDVLAGVGDRRWSD